MSLLGISDLNLRNFSVLNLRLQIRWSHKLSYLFFCQAQIRWNFCLNLWMTLSFVSCLKNAKNKKVSFIFFGASLHRRLFIGWFGAVERLMVRIVCRTAQWRRDVEKSCQLSALSNKFFIYTSHRNDFAKISLWNLADFSVTQSVDCVILVARYLLAFQESGKLTVELLCIGRLSGVISWKSMHLWASIEIQRFVGLFSGLEQSVLVVHLDEERRKMLVVFCLHYVTPFKRSRNAAFSRVRLIWRA